MAPIPIDDVDGPLLSDKVLEVLRMLWTLVSELCIVSWYYISEAFWAVWTYPPIETFRNMIVAVVYLFAAAVIGMIGFVITHPFMTIFLFLFVVPAVFDILGVFFLLLLHCLGFAEQGILQGSYAANYQSINYGGNVLRGSTFARFQSQGARGGRQ